MEMQKIEKLKKEITKEATSNNPIKEYYPDLKTFMRAVNSISPQSEYKCTRNIVEIYLNPTKEEYNNIVQCYLFRFNFGHSVLSECALNNIVQFIGNTKVLEVGAGNCYHGHALKLSGVDIIMTDIKENEYPGRHMISRRPWAVCWI